jgi:Uma2 family endonuclease
MAIQKTNTTVEAFEQFVNLPENADRRFELIDGEIIEVPSNAYSSEISSTINRHLGNFVYERKLGHVTGEQGGYMVAGQRIAPDVAYISKERQAKLAREGYNPNPPNLAVEVMSPTDDPELLEKKLAKYAKADVPVWVVWPDTRRVKVHMPGEMPYELGIGDVLDGGAILPGFKLAIADIFPEEE